MQDLRRRIEQYIVNVVPDMPCNRVFFEDKNDSTTLKQLQDMQLYDPYFAAYLYKSKFEDLAANLLDETVIGKTIEYFNKPPKIGQPTPPHQDAFYFMLQPPQALTMWLALETVDEENGCVRYIKGSHLRGMRIHAKSNIAGFSQGIADYSNHDFQTEIPIVAKSGDLLIHHAMTVHRADANKSEKRSRKALGLIYFGESAKEDVQEKQAYQKQLAGERSETV